MLTATLLAVSLLLRGGAGAPAAPAAATARAPFALTYDFETAADSNANWPAGWRRGGNRPTGVVRLDTPGHGGGHAALLSMPDSTGLLALVHDLPESLRAGVIVVRLSGWLRTENAGSAGLFVRAAGRTSESLTEPNAGSPARGTTEWTRHEVLLAIPPELEHVIFGVRIDGGGAVWADDVVLELMHPGEQPPSAPVAMRYFDAAIDSICRRSVLSSELRWDMLKSAARIQLVGAGTPEETYPALRYAIHRLDSMGELLGAAEAAARRDAPAEAVAIYGYHFGNGIGWVSVPACTGRSTKSQAAYAEELRRAVANADTVGLRGWVVDLRGTGPGELEPLLAGLAPILGEGRAGGAMRPDGVRQWWNVDHGQLAMRPVRGARTRAAAPSARDSLPVAVLTDTKTAFEGEAAVLAFRGRPNTRIFGESTRGVPLERETIRLRDGAEIRFATAHYTDRTGHFSDGPIDPDERVSASRKLVPGTAHDSCSAVALRWLEAQAGRPR